MKLTKIFSSLVLAMLMTACHSSNAMSEGKPETDVPAVTSLRGNPELEAKMQQIVAGDPVKDAEQALKSGDKRFWVYYKRAERIVPGVETPMPEAEGKVAPGMGDVVYGARHKTLRKQLLDYMQRYNQRIQQAR